MLTIEMAVERARRRLPGYLDHVGRGLEKVARHYYLLALEVVEGEARRLAREAGHAAHDRDRA